MLAFSIQRGANGHLPMLRELDRIVSQVQQHLLQARRIAANRGGDLRVDRGNQTKALLRRHERQAVGHGFDNRRQVEVDRLQLQLASLNLGKVKYVVDQGQQRLSGRPRERCMPPLLLVQIGAEEQLRHADHAVERRTQLVAHVGEKLAFCGAGPRGPRGHLVSAHRLVGQVPVGFFERTARFVGVLQQT